jgi:1-aminocyclopropane-1-carboxylate deaminase
LSVLLPGGTCSTAFILHRELRLLKANRELATDMDIQVVVIPCVGDEGYAERQMMALNMDTGGNGDKGEIPQVLKPAPGATFYLEGDDDQRYFRFGEPDVEILHTFREMESYGVKVDLLYGAPSWNVLLRHWPIDGQVDASNILSGREIMYVHSGGLEGISSQLMRYRHKGLVKGNEVQHPERQRRSSREFLDKNQE